MKIVLTGFMGTGKTSVGKELSGQLNYTFIDTDVLIEQKEGMPISLIFKNKGENYFRELEQATVAEVSELDNVVIATGGGVIKNKKNVINLGKRGVLVWLKADPEIILRRVMLEGGKRPLLDVEEPLHEINKLLEERVELYRQADTSIDTTYITPGETAHEIIEKLGLESERVRVDLGARSYEIIIGSRLMQKLGLRIREFRPSKVAIISNKKVFPIYRDSILKSLREYNYDPEILLMPDGEEYKDILWTYHFHGELLKARFDRSSLLIALGGGVIGDITGFVASTYMRGIRFIQVPTTLLSQVDSSVGGKTGVNHPLGKNMIGTFYQPSLVFIDIDTLKTLPTNEFLSGMAEVIKYGIIADREFFDYLTTNKDDILSFGDSIIHVIKRSCEIKADVVAKDEQESGLRAILNFGHTIGHAIETVTAYKKFLHGEAIAIGMCAAAELALKSGIFSSDDASLIREIIESYNLPSLIPGDVNTEEILHTMELDKKVTAGKMKFVLPEAIGKVRIEDNVARQLIRDVIESCQIQ